MCANCERKYRELLELTEHPDDPMKCRDQDVKEAVTEGVSVIDLVLTAYDDLLSNPENQSARNIILICSIQFGTHPIQVLQSYRDHREDVLEMFFNGK